MNTMKRAWEIRKEAAIKFGCKVSELYRYADIECVEEIE